MSNKITDEKLLEILENQPDMAQEQIGKTLGISQQAISKRIKALIEKGRFNTAIQDRITRSVFKYIKNLEEQSKGGKTIATKILLEMANLYTPKLKQEIEEDNKMVVEIIDSFATREKIKDAVREYFQCSDDVAERKIDDETLGGRLNIVRPHNPGSGNEPD